MHSVQKAAIVIKSCTQKWNWKEIVKQLKLHPPTQQLNGPPPETTRGKKEQRPYTSPIANFYVTDIAVPWVPEDIFFFLSILMVRGEAASTRHEAPREKNNLWSQELRVPFPFKVDRLQIILVAKKYISTCHNCSSVGCLKCVQFHNWFRLH